MKEEIQYVHQQVFWGGALCGVEIVCPDGVEERLFAAVDDDDEILTDEDRDLVADVLDRVRIAEGKVIVNPRDDECGLPDPFELRKMFRLQAVLHRIAVEGIFLGDRLQFIRCRTDDVDPIEFFFSLIAMSGDHNESPFY